MVDITNKTDYKFCRRKSKRLVEAFFRTYKLGDASVSLAVIKSGEMRKLNKAYRGIDKSTDVLSFSNPDFKKNHKAGDRENLSLLGEVLISADEIKKLDQYQDMFAELGLKPSFSKVRSAYLFYFLFAHGLLHLVGYDDATEQGRLKMLSLGKDLMDKAGI